MEQFIFFVCGLLSLLGGLLLVVGRRMRDCLVGLFVVLLALVGLFLLLNRPLLALFLSGFYGAGLLVITVLATAGIAPSIRPGSLPDFTPRDLLNLSLVGLFFFGMIYIFKLISQSPGLPGDFALALAGREALQFLSQLIFDKFPAVLPLLSLILLSLLTGGVYFLGPRSGREEGLG